MGIKLSVSVFRVPSSGGLSALFEPVFSFVSTKTFFVTNRITGWAIASISSFLFFQPVAVDTMRLGQTLHYNPVAGAHINHLRNKLKVFWVTARGVATRVIDLQKLSSCHSSWYRRNQVRIHDSVSSFCFAPVPQQPVTSFIPRAHPVPAGGSFFNLSKNTSLFFWAQIYS